MISFYSKYIPGNVYDTYIVISISEIIACFLSGYFVKWFSPEFTTMASFLTSAIFAILMILIPTDHTWLILILLLVTKFGISIAVSLVYVISSLYFPT